MDISIKSLKDVTLVEMKGDIDANTATDVQQKVLPLAQKGSKILLDLTEVPYTSSAGLRLLLSLHRQVGANKGQLVLAGLSEDIEDTMKITGFLDFFTRTDTVADGLKKLE